MTEIQSAILDQLKDSMVQVAFVLGTVLLLARFAKAQPTWLTFALILLPIPILDGGVILMLLVEMVMQRDLSLKVLDRSELAIDTCEAEVGDLVQLPQRSQDRNSDLIGRYFGLTQGP